MILPCRCGALRSSILSQRYVLQIHQQHGTRSAKGCIVLQCRGPPVVPVSRYSACEIAWHVWEKLVLVVCGVVPITAIVPVFLTL